VTTSHSVVIDASAAVRGYLRSDGSARRIVDDVLSGRLVAHAPDLILPEVTNALRVRVDAERWPVSDAVGALQVLLDRPVAIEPCRPLATTALEYAAGLGISAYDAFYAVLAGTLEVPLVTADRRLAGVVPGSILVS
jgi:predicted nucleic acid-binding protein